MSNLSKNSTPKLAIVIPCYNEEAVIAHTYKALCEKLDLLIAQNAIAKDSFLCFVDDGSKDKTCEILLSLKSANNSIDKTHCHTERSEVSKDKNAHLQNHLDSSVASLPQNDNENILHNDNETSLHRNDNVRCHTEGVARSIQNIQKENLQGNDMCLDSSVASLTQNDNKTTLPHNDNAKVCNDGVKNAPILSIVIPCYNEEAVIAHTYKALSDKLNSLIAQNMVAKDSFLCFVDDGSKDKTCEILLSLKSANNSIDKAHCHTERSEVSKGKSVALQNHLDSSVASLPQNDRENTLPHNDNAHCHTEGIARSIQNIQKENLQGNDMCLDSSVASLPQNDDENILHNDDKITLTQNDNKTTLPQNDKENAATKPYNTDTNTKSNSHKIIKLTKNYGHQNALLAGLHFVKDKCDCVVSMDCDLQDDINAVDEMLDKFKNGADIVYGVRKARDKDTAFKKYTALGFYKFMHIMGVKIIYNHADYRLLSARACESLLEFKEVNLFLRGIVPLLGHKSEVVYYERAARFAGTSKYPLGKMLSFAWNGITSFSITPLRVMSVIGVILCALSVIYGAYALYMKFFTTEPISGWTSTILILLFFGGMQFLGLGIMGEYIGKIYAEVKHRPRYFVDEIL